jgi:hypothetical protein
MTTEQDILAGRINAALEEWDAIPAGQGHAHAATQVAAALLAAGYVKAQPDWLGTSRNDGEYEYVTSSDCDGSNVHHWRRRPARRFEQDAGPWEAYEPKEGA